MRGRKKGWCYWVGMAVLSVCLSALSPTCAEATVQESQNYFNVVYNNLSGMPTSEANDVVQTPDGTIWIASYSSLLRYDGKEFHNYADIQGLTSVLCLFVDSKGRLWIGTNNDGVVLYENNTFYFLGEEQDIPSYSTRSICEMDDGSILVGTALGIYKIAPDFSVEVMEDVRVQGSFILELEPYGDNEIFGITKTGDVFLMQGTKITDYIPMEEWDFDLPLCVLPQEDENGVYFLVGTNSNALISMRRSQGDTSKFQYEMITTETLKYVNTLFQDSQDTIWIGTDSGVGYFTHSGKLVILDYLTVNQSIENIAEDQEGNYWLASSKEGLMKLNPSRFKNLSAELDDVVQFNAVEILDGYIYVASSNGIDIINQSDLTVVENTLTERYRGKYFRCIQKDAQGNLWLSSYTEDGLVKYNPKTEEITHFNVEGGINYSRIRSTMTASDGKIWVASGNGVYVVENDKVIAHFGSEEGLQSLEILTISEDFEGRVFIGTDGAGVYVMEDLELVYHINRSTGLLSDVILRTETDPFNGGTWIVTGNSIAFYDPATKVVKNIEKFPYGNNFDLLFYENIMVVLCSNGIYFTTQEEMLSDDPTLVYRHKNHMNGLYSAPVANSFSVIYDGILYLCGYKNLTSYNIKEETEEYSSSFVPPISIASILVNDEKQYPTSEQYYLLSNRANFIQLDVFIPTYALEDYRVVYSLLGYDEFFHNTSYEAYVDPTYTNLPGGEYEFVVQLIDNRTGNLVNEERFRIMKEYTLTEHPTIQGVVRCFMLIAICELIRVFLKHREKKSQEKQAEVTGMFRDTVSVLSKVIDAKDCYTNGHSQRVAEYTRAITTALQLSPEEVESAYGVALLHDVGKVSIPDNVLNKPGRLDREEFEIMKTHAGRGADILEGIKAWPDLVVGAKYHHERYDGNGYAYGLKGTEIPLIARVICVADAFDAMYSSRVYRKKMELEDVVGELLTNSGTQFDPEIVKVFVDLIHSGRLDDLLKKFSREDEEGERVVQA